ncbi:uncharacterized protein LOC135644161 [Musa acuminata AAA Group]|uniref:uncharacterized protein LOC135644161 n=1 Tax=Musa acuminata AAA Group TaxID=214697 RepID=UPI0031DC2802
MLLGSCRPRPPPRHGLPVRDVLLGLISLGTTSSVRPARPRHAPWPHVARDHLLGSACPPETCSSATCRPRPPPWCGLPARDVLLGLMSPETTSLERPARPRHAPQPHVARDHLLGVACPPETCSSAHVARDHLLGTACPLETCSSPHVARDHLLGAAYPPETCSSTLCRLRPPPRRGLPARGMLLGLMSPETTSSARPARPRRARPHVALDYHGTGG